MDLTTQYLGLTLANPLVASAGPLNANLGFLQRLEDAGAGAVVLPSLFEEQIASATGQFDAIMASAVADNNPEAHYHYLPTASIAQGPYGLLPDQYLEHVRRARESLSIPVIASLNGSSPDGWENYGRLLQQAGAHALELNLNVTPYTIEETGESVEQRCVQVVQSLRAQLDIPLAVKISSRFTAPVNMAMRFAQAGANGLVIFNRTLEPEIDLRTLKLKSEIAQTCPVDIRLPLQWIALIAGRVPVSLAASTGVESATEVIKYLYAGADVVMATSAVMREGPQCFTKILKGLREWLDVRGVSPGRIRGLMSFARLKDPGVYIGTHAIDALKVLSSAAYKKGAAKN
jgi:dihydroorotate dehydrogenase (fumarate)